MYHLHLESYKMFSTSLFTKQKLIPRYRKQIYGYEGKNVRKDKLGIGVDIYTLLYTKERTNENLLYSL